MFNRIKISIIIPAYNADDSLIKCMDSVLFQTHENIQIIIVDDGSTDNTYNLCENFAVKDRRIEVYHTENKGSVAARKLGLNYAKGDYIGFVDADDYIESDMFYELLELMLKYDLDFIHSGFIEEQKGKKTVISNYNEVLIETESIESKVKFIAEYILKEDKNKNISPSIWSKLFKAKFIKECFSYLPDEQQYGEDFLCLCKCILESQRFMLCKKTMYHYVLKEKSLSHIDFNTYMFREIGLWHYLIKLFEEYQCLEILKTDIYNFLKRRMISVLEKDNLLKVPMLKYYFKDIEKIMGKSIVIFGAGSVGQDYYKQFSIYAKCNVVAWIDTNWNKYPFAFASVIGLDKISTLIFDLIIIAVYDEKTAMQIKTSLMHKGIDDKKIYWEKPGRYF